MRLTLLLTCTLLMTSLASAQLFERGQVWLNIDSVPYESSLLHRHALMTIQWNLSARGAQDIAISVDRLQAQYPWLSAVAIHIPALPVEASPLYVQKFTQRLGLDFPVLVDTLYQEDESELLTEVRFQLRDPEGTELMPYQVMTPSNLAQLSNELQAIENIYTSSGQTLDKPFFFRSKKPLRAFALFDSPYDLIYDESQRRLIMSDTEHDRVVVSTADGQVIDCIGSGVRGDQLGETDMAKLNRPQGLAYLADQDQLYIADYGNSRIVIASLQARDIGLFTFHDEDGYEIQLPGAPTQLSLEGQMLTVTMPIAKKVWTIDLSRNRLVAEYGADQGTEVYHKKQGKFSLSHPSSAISHQGHTYIYDASQRTIYDIADKRVNVLWSCQPKLVDGHGGQLAEPTMLSTLRMHDDRLYLIDQTNSEITEIELEHGTASPLMWNEEGLSLELATALAWGDKNIYILDSEGSQVVEVSQNAVDHIRWTDVHRLFSGAINDRDLIGLPNLSVSSTEQTEIALHTQFPHGYSLHPSLRSTIMKPAGVELYEEQTNLRESPLSYVVMPGFKKNQINLIGEIYFTEIGKPWKVYQRFVQIMAPVVLKSELVETQSLDVNLLEGVNLGD